MLRSAVPGESRFGNTASTGKGTVGPVWGRELARSRCDREESRQGDDGGRERACARWITEMSWPGVEEGVAEGKATMRMRM